MQNVSVSKIIRLSRKKKRMTQFDLADSAGCSNVTISHVERGVPISYDLLHRICQSLDLDASEMFNCQNRTYQPPPNAQQYQISKIIDIWYMRLSEKLKNKKSLHDLTLAKEDLKLYLSNPFVFDE